MATTNEAQFQGWVAVDENSVGNLKWQAYEPKPWEETDVDIEITHCGICGSDLHTLRSGWVRIVFFASILKFLSSLCR
jgi:alcohol dehydrogenase (NADP+)